MNLHAQKSPKLDYSAVAARLLFAATCIIGCTKSNPVAAPAQPVYASPDEAGQALESAAKVGDSSIIARILGPKSQAILNSGDPTEDRAALQSFSMKFDRMNRWVKMTDGSFVLYIGADNYPFPIPLTKDSSSKWHFDTAAGEQEILARRIGKNELLAIDASTSIGNAEELYKKKSGQYTATIFSAPGTQNGLHWEASGGQNPSPLGDFAKLANPSALNGAPVFDGYTFRILTAQGDKARGGAQSYIVNGKQTGGFAVLATPVKYQDSGIMSFILSREGIVYQKDLGAKTADVTGSITEYNPTDGWTPAE